MEVLTRRLGLDGGRATCDSVAPHISTNMCCVLDWGLGSALRPPRNQSGKLGHSSAPLMPHSSSGKSTCSLSFHGLKVLQDSGCPSSKRETELQGAGNMTLPMAHPAVSLNTATTGGKISMVMQHSYCTEQSSDAH